MIPQQPTQLSLTFDPDLAEQFISLKDCVSTQIHRQRGGIRAVAGKLDMSPSHLSEVLGGGGERNRKFDLDELEAYIEEFEDLTPIQYLIAKYMPDQAVAQAHAFGQISALAEQLPQLFAAAGVKVPKKIRKGFR